MNPISPPTCDDSADAHVDAEIAECLNLDAPRSFFLFAGAGSGKTRSLVRALEHVKLTMGDRLSARGQKVAVITYTNAACDEIKRRLLFDSLIHVSTIHSFAWSLVEGLNHDIREWLRLELADDIQQLSADEAKGRKGTKASIARLNRIKSKTERLANLPTTKSFTYSPSGDNRGRDALNHSEVLKLAATFFSTKSAMQSILSGRYPILLIDESQDTNKQLINAFFEVEAKLKDRFVLGLFGDTMQRIYNGGKEGLGQSLPTHWATPTKVLNHRCPKRVVALINKIRAAVDQQVQRPINASVEGFIRLFILPSSTVDKYAAERAVADHMREITGDKSWGDLNAVKTLALEHRVAAIRMGFLQAFDALYGYESWRTAFLDGSLTVLRFFTAEVLPLFEAHQANDRFAIARIAKTNCPRLSQASLLGAADPKKHMDEVGASIERFMALWVDDSAPLLLDVLKCAAYNDLFEIPESLKVHASEALEAAVAASADDESADAPTDRDAALQAFLAAPFSQIQPMAEYLAGRASFDTHQGVKGLEFDRVMVIMDDSEARGFTFKYEDLLGGIAAGSSTVESTRRLFYVTASRAKQSLAMVVYCASPDKVRDFVISQNWFDAAEVISGDAHAIAR